MFNKKMISLGMCLLFLTSLWAGCIGQQAEEAKVEVSQELTIAVVRDHDGHKDFGVWRAHIFETLVGVASGAMKPEPMLATHWEVADDGLA
jgi:ABC-type transport system substrate-binding protein